MKTCPQCKEHYDDDLLEACPNDATALTLVAPEDDEPDPMLGKMLDDRYKLILKIGEGGMGAIYKAVHQEMGRTCAIKLLTGLTGGKDDALARFKREAKMASRIDNSHAVTIYDYGQAEGMPFLAMEFVDGKPLSRILAEQRTLSIDRVVHITSQIAEGLAAAHALEIVHRDLKPDNIMLTRKGADADYVKVLDFGIAKTVADDAADNLTKTGFVLGTPLYMSPEQLLGEKLDPRSDIYSLAIIVYEMLSGKLPFEGDNPQSVMMKRITSNPVKLRTAAPHVSESVERAVMAALVREPDGRTPTVEAFAAAINNAVHTGTQMFGGRVTESLGEAQSAAGVVDAGVSVPRDPAMTQVLTAESARSAIRGSTVAPRVAAAELTINDPGFDTRTDPTSVRTTVEADKRQGRSKAFLAGVAILLLVVAGVGLYFVMTSSTSGVALVLKDVPQSAEVFINDVQQNGSSSGGAINIKGLVAGPLNIRISKAGLSSFVTSITANEGDRPTVSAVMWPLEIDQKGAMVLIPAGEFVMGDDEGQPDEKPAHKVSLPAYYIDKYEVTNAQYKLFCDATGEKPPPDPPTDKDYFKNQPDAPVLGVTFDQALKYAEWAGKRLPTEEEWEKAASWDPSLDKKRKWPWGGSSIKENANIGTQHPAPVTQYSTDRSAYGVIDMAGNVNEWVDAAYKPYPDGRSPAVVDKGYGSPIARGGNFLDASKIDTSRTTYRNFLPRTFPTGFSTPVGIRCAVFADNAAIQQQVRERTK